MGRLPIRIDYSLAMHPGTSAPGGLDERELDACASRFTEALDATLHDVRRGALGFWGLGGDPTIADAIDAVVAKLPAVDDVMVLGIGGSSLGGRSILEALRGPTGLGLPITPGPRVHFPDNSDPFVLRALFEHLRPERTLVVAISKSGGTVETAAALLLARAFLRDALGEKGMRERLVIITDPESGPLRDLAWRESLASLPVPKNVGGRFSVLTAVGLLPAALAGVDVRALLRGADAMRAACETRDLRKNPAGLFAALHVLHHERHGRGIHVLMPYADALRPFATWFVQLWAESLGKRVDLGGNVVERGPTPIPAVGATDQHAQVQLFMEGPRDKLITFIAVDEPAGDLAIPHEQGVFDDLGGLTMAGLLDAERRGTALALARDGRPSLTLHVPRIDAFSLGSLFFFFEAATAFAGRLYGVDAFGQPGVELGKRLASALLGRAGFESEREMVRETESNRNESHVLE
ncbi:MAG: glucose-6-phosphate isomerase [Myxococcales bacterium]|nr:glucose-6-phosphate isomerase [Myxococcales bacterium]